MGREKLPLHQTIIADIIRQFFKFLYLQFAFAYDWVAAIVSLGMWDSWILATLPFLKDQNILELGHGTGKLLLQLQRRDVFSVGIDESRQMGKLAKSKLDKRGYSAMVMTAEAQYLPIRSLWFDQVVATFPSNYIVDPNTLMEVERVLKPEGELIILPYAWITGRSWMKRFASWIFKITGQSPEWTGNIGNSFKLMGFDVKVHKVTLESSELPILIATKVNN